MSLRVSRCCQPCCLCMSQGLYCRWLWLMFCYKAVHAWPHTVIVSLCCCCRTPAAGSRCGPCHYGLTAGLQEGRRLCSRWSLSCPWAAEPPPPTAVAIAVTAATSSCMSAGSVSCPAGTSYAGVELVLLVILQAARPARIEGCVAAAFCLGLWTSRWTSCGPALSGMAGWGARAPWVS